MQYTCISCIPEDLKKHKKNKQNIQEAPQPWN